MINIGVTDSPIRCFDASGPKRETSDWSGLFLLALFLSARLLQFEEEKRKKVEKKFSLFNPADVSIERAATYPLGFAMRLAN